MKKEILALILLLSIAHAATSYYANIEINVDSQGYVTITGNTNYPNLTTTNNPIYTSKKANYWTLNITKPEQFSEFIYKVELPETASINYVKTTGTFTITNQGNNLEIKGYGENKPLEIIIQYQINKETDNLLIMSLSIIPIILVTAGVYYFYKKKKSKRKKQATRTNKNQKKKKTKKEQTKKIKLPPLPERQEKIMKLLIEKGKPLTQAQIRKELNLPKASTTRNINALEIKGLITKEQVGITNLIKIKE